MALTTEKARLNRITRELLSYAKNNQSNDSWRWLNGSKKGQSVSKRTANKFLLACILDYQIPGDLAWRNAGRLAEQILGNPADLWKVIGSFTERKWKSKWREYSLHRFPAAHFRVWRIGKAIWEGYGGDARNIWRNQTVEAVTRRLEDLRVGKQLSRMIIGALIDTNQVRGRGDVKVDRHIRRILGRVLIGKPYSEREHDQVTVKTRQMFRVNPWILDYPLYTLATTVCTNINPNCTACILKTNCTFFARQRFLSA